MMRVKRLFIYVSIFLFVACNNTYEKQNLPIPKYLHYRKSDTLLFGKREQIHLLTFNYDDVLITLGVSSHKLLKTSAFAKKENAVAGINGSFFDRDKGGSVVYMEKNNQVISYKKKSDTKWTKPDSLVNGIIILTKNKELQIEKLKEETYYEKSNNEIFAIASGAILLKDSVSQRLPKMEFCTKKHPRTCIAKRKNKILFLVIDGRNSHSEGISLMELQRYLLNLGYTDAINLDGGGSSTMWIKNRGVVNSPSDSEGERVVANSFLILSK